MANLGDTRTLFLLIYIKFCAEPYSQQEQMKEVPR